MATHPHVCNNGKIAMRQFWFFPKSPIRQGYKVSVLRLSNNNRTMKPLYGKFFFGKTKEMC
jgi:hypothetical protein